MSQLSGVPLSVLDTSPIVDGSDARTALSNTVDLARLADRLGYHRYWVPEHHSMRGVASAAPAVVVGRIAAATDRIRVGSGGVLLPNHAPIVVAEQFGTLEAFFPGRIDLGIGRATGGPRYAAAAVLGGAVRPADRLDEQLVELLAYFEPRPAGSVRAIPAEGNRPETWLLGSTDFSARVAGTMGLRYAFAHHLEPDGMESALAVYRESFRPSVQLDSPTVLVSVSVLVADTDDEARWLAGSHKLKVLRRRQGSPVLLPTPEEAAAYPYTDDDVAFLEEQLASEVIGCVGTVEKRLRQILDDSAADELMVTTRVHSHSERRRSYELLADLTH